ncbi:helix-turn-helix transcriptional regulator [Micromonospora parathelypteridis]|uniref:DNA-binding CsgD family transcriptional regulator/DNA-binding transcriptional ArsR family regulator n=1 Tax=Micromonospora parathelypteridis TaxID=1839617 RepID=A0A840VH30_9ACTN|nr:LuxR family transcriptional regulator [Micromonospora parathelypteridis]MBB5476123.1 DNA-binding CsgD family transcriptional regulator/DNA-binding transcriptional ArsR family regulator [Micromonospora parathelypteridis]GGO32798.1 LuxR family transcriptional regulator [Micromonospora parathelypteridis]
MSTPTLIERDTQIAVLENLLVGATEGSGHIAMISGAVASGKSELLVEVADQAVARGAVVLDAVASCSERNVRFGVVRKIIDSLPVAPDIMAVILRLLEEATEPMSACAALMAYLSTTLLHLSERRPVVIAIDDIHRADNASKQYLLHLSRRIRRARVLILLTTNVRTHRDEADFHSELQRQPHFTRLRLRMLSKSGTTRLISGQLGAQTAARLADEVHSATGGNPLLVRALVEDARVAAEQTTTDAEPLVRAETYVHGVLDCLHRGEPDMLSVARAIAALGTAATPLMISRLLDMQPRAVVQALEDLNRCGLIDEGQFRDPTARAAVLDHAPAEVLYSLRDRAARLLFDCGAPPTDVARQLVLRGRDTEPWTVPVLCKAADYALVDDDTEFARRCLELAYRVCPDQNVRAEINSRLIRATWRTAPAAARGYLSRLTPATMQDQTAYQSLPMSVAYLSWAGQVDRAIDIVAELTDAPEAAGPSAVTAINAAQNWLTAFIPHLRPRFTLLTSQDATPDTDSGTTLADTASGSQHALPYLHAASAYSAALSGDVDTTPAVDEAIRVLQRYHLTDNAVHPLVSALWALIYADRLDLALSWCERLLDECSSRDTPSWRAMLTVVRAEIALRLGELGVAENHARVALNQMSTQSWGLGIAQPLAVLVQAYTAMGRYDEAMRMLDQSVPPALSQTTPGLHYRQARGRWYLATGRPHAALETFLACGESMEAYGMDNPQVVPWRIDAAEAWLALGEPKRAKDLAEEQLRRSGRGLRGQRAVLLRILGSIETGPRRLPMLREAVEILEDGGNRLQLALALGELGRCHQAEGDVNQARMLVRKAWHLAKSCGAEPLCEQLIPGYSESEVTPPTRGTLPRSPETEPLTEAEARVAALAAEGHTNREIAAQLFVTVSTVEQHLTRIYRKLDVRRRRDLPTKLSGVDSRAVA